ncbi:MAG: MFS transporter [Aggregatilineales bacterium]
MSAASVSTANNFLMIAPGRRRLALALILIPVFIGALDLTIVSAILPEVLVKLNIPLDTNLGQAAWAVTGYLLAYTVSMTLMGRISDLAGRRSVYLVCLAVFVIGSWWVATCTDFPTTLLNTLARQVLHQRPDLNELTLLAVIIGRVVQALGAGAMVPVSLALVGDMYPREQRAQPIGIVGAIDTGGWVLGHLYGGLMVNFFNSNSAQLAAIFAPLGLPTPDWRTLFWLNVPIGLIALALTGWALRGVPHPTGRGKFDGIGALLLAGALTIVTLGFGGNSDVSGSTSFDALSGSGGALFNLPLLIGGVVTFAVFIAWTLRRRDPLLDLRLFRKRNVSAASLTNLLVGFCLMLGLVSVPLLVNLRAKNASAEAIAQAAQQAGLLLSGLTIPMALAAIPGGWLSNRLGYRTTTMIGLALAAIGFATAGLTWNATTPDLLMAAQMAIAGIGLGLTIAPIGTAVINDAPDDERGVTAALVIILRLLGMTIAVSSMTAYSLARVGTLVSAAVAAFPAGLSADELQKQSVAAYYGSGIQVIGEMLLIGAVASVIALLPAMLLRGNGATQVPAEHPASSTPRSGAMSASD